VKADFVSIGALPTTLSPRNVEQARPLFPPVVSTVVAPKPAPIFTEEEEEVVEEESGTVFPQNYTGNGMSINKLLS
jgi:hypothetical protein